MNAPDVDDLVPVSDSEQASTHDLTTDPPDTTETSEPTGPMILADPGLEITLPIAAPADGIIVEIEGADDRCLVLNELTPHDGLSWVTPPEGRADFGIVCQTCPNPVSVFRGGGRYVLPSATPPSALVGPLTLVIGERDCVTGVPVASTTPVPLSFHSRIDPVRQAQLTLPVELVLTTDSAAWETDDARLEEAVLAAGPFLERAGIQLDWRGIRRTSDSTATLVLGPWNHASIDALGAERPHRDEEILSVWFVGELEWSDPLVGLQHDLLAYTPRIPGGAAPDKRMADVILASAFALPEASIIAHEMGHWLGLYHQEGSDGLMAEVPNGTYGDGLEEWQIEVMRRHPALQE